MPNPGTFRGSRLAFLDSQAEVYANGVRNNQLVDTVADIQRRYLKRYPMSLDHNVEPTQEWLDSVDDSAPDPEVQPPSLDSAMDNAAYSAALEKFNKLMNETKARKESIKRRLAYVYSKSCGKDVFMDAKGKRGVADPLTALKAKLAGVELKVPRIRTAYNVWGPQNRATVDPVFNKRVQDGNVPTNQQLALRSSIYKELFEELSAEEQQKWADMAKEEHSRALEHLKVQEKRAASHSNADYQRVISALPSIVQPMLDLLCEHTGWKFSLEGGGPEPADGGRLNMIFMHSGVAPGGVSVGFGGAEREAFKKSIMPAFGRYLKRCYNKDACMARALPPNHGTATLADVRFEEDVDVSLYRVEHDKPAPKKRLFEEEMDRLNKGKSKAPPPTGTPSPMVRFGPPIGKRKNRILPTKDNPASLVPNRGSSTVFKTSPLAQNVITADDSGPAPSSGVTAPEPVLAAASSRLRDDMPVATSAAELSSDPVTASTTSMLIPDPSSSTAPSETTPPASPTSTARAASTSAAATDSDTSSSTAFNSAVVLDCNGRVSNVQGLGPRNDLAHERGTDEPQQMSPPPSPSSTRAPSLPPSPVPSRSTSPAGLANELPAGSDKSPHGFAAPSGDETPPGTTTPDPSSPCAVNPRDVLTPSVVALCHGDEAPPRDVSTPSVVAPRHTDKAQAPARDVSIPRGVATPPRGAVASPPRGVATPPRSVATPPRGAVASPPRGVATPPRSVATPPRGAATSPPHSVATSPPRSVATPPRGVATPPSIDAPPRRETTPPSTEATPPSTKATPPGVEPPSHGVSAPPGVLTSSRVVNLHNAAAPSAIQTPPGAATVPMLENVTADQPLRTSTKRAGSDVRNSAPSKKQRISGRAFTTIASAADCPDWVTRALDLLASADLGPAWRQLVELWASLEAKHGFNKKAGMLSASGRPIVVHQWIKRGRDPAYQPDIGNLAAFEATYTSWWRSIQPDWRLSADGASLVRGGGDWGATKCTGLNGLLSVLAALFYWGIAAGNDAAAKAPWEVAVEDATYVFESIAT